jgi:cob(I)alamin adenosyltransferase
VAALEAWIDGLTAGLPPLENFVLPGGTPGAGWLHLARTVCRRAERRLVTLARSEPVGEFAVRYLNRLSDLLFVMARSENRARGEGDVLWDSRA